MPFARLFVAILALSTLVACGILPPTTDDDQLRAMRAEQQKYGP
jgi:hypothetical protein